MYLVRLMCTKHDVDLECVEETSNGNPEDGLFRIRTDRHFSSYDTSLAFRCGIVDTYDRVLKPGTWYTLDFSSFACPGMSNIPDDLTPEQEDQFYCTAYWVPIMEEIDA